MSLLRVPCLLPFVFVFTLLSVGARHGAPDDNFTPEVNGTIHDLYVYQNGDVLIVGEFTKVNGVNRSRIARISADGTLADDFTQGANDTITHLVPDNPDSPTAFYLAGSFDRFARREANGLCRISSTGAHDPTFDTRSGASGTIHSLAYDFSSGILVVGGRFSTFGGQRTRNLILLTSLGATLPGWSDQPLPNNTVRAVATYADSRRQQTTIIVGGEFSKIGEDSSGFFTTYLFSDAGEEPTLAHRGSSLIFDDEVTSFAQSSDRLAVAGEFSSVSGSPRDGIAMLGPAGTNAGSSSIPVEGGFIEGMSFSRPSPDRHALLAYGSFSRVGGYEFPGLTITALRTGWPSEGTDGSFNPGPINGQVFAGSFGPNAEIYICGAFSEVDGKPRQNIARLYSHVGGDPPAAPYEVEGVAKDNTSVALWWNMVTYFARGRGEFDNVRFYRVEQQINGTNQWKEVAVVEGETYPEHPIPRIASVEGLEPDTTYQFRIRAQTIHRLGPPSESIEVTTRAVPPPLKQPFDLPFSEKFTEVGFNAVLALSDGRILVAGAFTELLGEPRPGIAALLPDGSLDPNFDPGTGPNGAVLAMQELPDGEILLAGSFTSYHSHTSAGICRIRSNGQVDRDFRSSLNAGTVNRFVLFPDNSILIGSSYLKPNGRLSETQVLPLDHIRNSISLHDGSVIVGDLYGQWSRWWPNGTRDLEWALPVGRANHVSVDSAGRLYLTGFTPHTSNGRTYENLLRLNADLTIDSSFQPPLVQRGQIRSTLPLRDGRVLLSGTFLALNDIYLPGFARLHANGSVDETLRLPVSPSFDSPFGQSVTLDRRNRLCMVSSTPIQKVAGSHLVRLIDESPDTLDAPTHLTASPIANSALSLNWTPSPGSFLTHLQRSRDRENWKTVSDLAVGHSTYLDQNLEAGTTYYYRALATSPAAESTPSAMVEGTTYSPVQEWLIAEGLGEETDPLSIPAGARSPLLLNYAFGLPARGANKSRLVVFSLSGRCYFLYPRVRESLHYQVLQSDDGQNWRSQGVDQGPPGAQGIASVPLEQGSTLLRLEVTPSRP